MDTEKVATKMSFCYTRNPTMPGSETRGPHQDLDFSIRVWQRVGNALAMHWQRIGNALATHWQRIGNALATRWQHVGSLSLSLKY